MVLRVDGRDLDGVRAALAAADPTGRRATPVMIARDHPGRGARRVPPDRVLPARRADRRGVAGDRAAGREPVDADGVAHLARPCGPDADLTSQDALGSDAEVDLGLVVTTATGTRRTIRLGTIPPPGEQATLAGDEPACAAGCRLAAVDFTAPPGVASTATSTSATCGSTGARSTGDPRRTTGTRPRTTAPRSARQPASDGALRLELGIQGFYPVELTPAWVPRTVPALLPAGSSGAARTRGHGRRRQRPARRLGRPAGPRPGHAARARRWSTSTRSPAAPRSPTTRTRRSGSSTTRRSSPP